MAFNLLIIRYLCVFGQALIIGALGFLVFELFFKEDKPTKGIASDIKKALEEDNAL